MIEREFRGRFRDVDAVVVGLLWAVYLRSTWDQRANVEAALGRLQSASELARYASDPRRSMAP